MVRLGIFGGTFNPIHVGHLVLAETARDQLSLDRVLFIPTHRPPHKQAGGLLPGAVRLKLIELAIQDHPAFVASDIELKRQGVSYSIDTVRTLRRELPRATLFLLLGCDMLHVRWVAWQELKKLCAIAVAPRPGPSPKRWEGGLMRLAMPRIEISSSDIRRRIQRGASIRYLVPPSVGRYIERYGLYRPANVTPTRSSR